MPRMIQYHRQKQNHHWNCHRPAHRPWSSSPPDRGVLSWIGPSWDLESERENNSLAKREFLENCN